MEKNIQGMGTPAIIAIVAVVLVLGGALYYGTRPEGEKMMMEGEEMMQDGDAMMKEGEAMMEEGEKMMKDGEAMMDEDGTMMMHDDYTGDRLAGTPELPLLDFNKEDYEKAVSEGKLVALFFYANWCPICRVEFPKMEEAFDHLPAISSVMVRDVVGFRVNYNDNQTDDYEKGLAKEFGVAYQHTKVFVRDGERLLKSPETWDMDRYISEITSRVK